MRISFSDLYVVINPVSPSNPFELYTDKNEAEIEAVATTERLKTLKVHGVEAFIQTLDDYIDDRIEAAINNVM
jgi:hypothetical protein